MNDLRHIEGLLAIPNGLAIPNTPPFMIDTDNTAFFHLKSDGTLLLHEGYTAILHEEDARSL